MEDKIKKELESRRTDLINITLELHQMKTKVDELEKTAKAYELLIQRLDNIIKED
jgi:hypothetical protein